MKRAISLLLSITMLLALVPQVAFAGVAGDRFDGTVEIANGLNYTATSQNMSDTVRRQSFSLAYTPNTATVPVVAYGNKLYGKSDINTVIKYYEGLGNTVMAAVNADFFHLNSGLPTGIVVRDGALVSSDGFWNGVAFSSDGKAVVGKPNLKINASSQNYMDMPIYAFNKERTNDGMYLYNSAFATDTKTSAGGTMVVMESAPGTVFRIGETLALTVKEVLWTGSTRAIGENEYILTYTNDYTPNFDLGTLAVGEIVLINTSVDNDAFAKALFATGGGDLIATNGALTSAAAKDKAPRTILGAKADGSFKIVATDGRQSEISDGISLADGANQLLNEGYTEIINFDGGGSTALAMRMPGDTQNWLVSSPSDGALRKCATYVLFVNKAEPKGATKGAVYPKSPIVLGGSTTPLSVLAYDDTYGPKGEVDASFSALDKPDMGNQFVAPLTEGEHIVSASSGSLSITPTSFTVVNTPDTLKMKKGSAAIDKMTVSPKAVIDFDATAQHKSRILRATDKDFKWSVTGNIGTVDENGVFTAVDWAGAVGSVVLTAGEKSVSVAVNVGSQPEQLLDFENPIPGGITVTGTEPLGTAELTKKTEEVRYGNSALKYTFNTAGANGFKLNTELKIGAKSLTLSIFPRIEGKLFADFTDATGKAMQVEIPFTNGVWQQLGVVLPAGANKLIGFSTLTTGAGGTVLFDGVWQHFGAPQVDATAPILQLSDMSDGIGRVYAFDDSPMGVKTDDIKVSIDGVKVEHKYESGDITFTLPTDALPHRVRITAKDFYKNISSVAFDTAGEIPNTTYADIETHWAKKQINIMTKAGVFAAAENFFPSDNVTNAMSATLVSRYLKLNTADYANITLPYADAKDIPAWALQHVKALYAKGIMIGGFNNGVHTFSPNASVTRAQIMTTIGRTIERGYSYKKSDFLDQNTVPAYAEDHISLLKHMGIVSGMGDSNMVMPNANITRSEMAAILYKMY